MSIDIQKGKEHVKEKPSVIRHSLETSNTKPYNISQMTGQSNNNNKPKK